jgi:serine/threonine-protein kinase
MNPYNIAELGSRFVSEKLSFQNSSRSFFIINKFYKGEISSGKLIESIYPGRGDIGGLDSLPFSKIYEVPYNEKVYLSWLYSCFGEPFKLGKLFTDKFGNAISGIVSDSIYPKKRHMNIRFRQLLNHRGGLP